jgi:ribosomal protein L7/L12
MKTLGKGLILLSSFPIVALIFSLLINGGIADPNMCKPSTEFQACQRVAQDAMNQQQLLGWLLIGFLVVGFVLMRLSTNRADNTLSFASPPKPKEVKTESGLYRVTLTDTGKRKIEVIKVLREATGIGLKEAKDLSESAPCVVVNNISRDEADTLARNLRNVGAQAKAHEGNAPVSLSDYSNISKLEEAQLLLEKGLITQEDYQTLKQRLLDL